MVSFARWTVVGLTVIDWQRCFVCGEHGSVAVVRSPAPSCRDLRKQWSIARESGLTAWRGVFPALPAGLMLGGAVANLLDRLIGGSVIDVLHTGWWPTFNAADSFITVGAGLLALSSLRPEHDEQ